MNGRRLSSLTAALLSVAMLAACGGGGGGTPPSSTPTPTPTGTPGPTISVTPGPASAAIYCDVNNPANPQSRIAASSMLEPSRRMVGSVSATGPVPGVVSAVYDRTKYLAARNAIRASAVHAGAAVVNELDERAAGTMLQILHVTPGTERAAIAAIKQNPGVISVGQAAYRHLESSTPAFTNDPFESGFAPGNTPPLYESQTTGGQWDLHVMCAANAWGYANTTNGTGVAHAGAAGGSASYPIAIIDTGADLTHPELQPASRIVYAEQVLNGVVTTGTATMHDNDGHGTNVAGIAAATGNNNFGFAGVAYNAPLMIFKVFPDPTSCSGTSCEASSADIATAINDAVAHGAKVISMSLGADTPATDEENAVAAAIAANVVVVAAAGNGNASTGLANPALSYPAADPGVIAVGASGIDDTNPATPNLKVASYSNYVPGSTTWGIVAPGGDACPGTSSSTPCGDSDPLHWIENIYSSTAAGASSNCRPDPNSSSATLDCRILIIGTSQATPHVSGAVALLLSAGVPQSPGTIKNLLCDSAQIIQSSDVNASHQGCGELDVYRAMAAALGDPTYP